MKRGLPASGKSTDTFNQIRKDGNKVRINRDDLRAMGFESKWTGKREKLIIAFEKTLACEALKMGYTPIIDDTNLMPYHLELWQEFAKNVGAEFIVQDHLDVPIPTCMERDSKRQGRSRVGTVVIERLAAKAGMLPKPEKPVVLCDIDGTVADLAHRKHFLEKTPKDWVSFFESLAADAPIASTIELVREQAKYYDIWMVSGRPDGVVLPSGEVFNTGDATRMWLQDYGIPFKHLLMRERGDHRPDTEVKQSILDKQILKNIDKSQIYMVNDDRPSVIRMWRSNGLVVNDVGDGVEF